MCNFIVACSRVCKRKEFCTFLVLPLLTTATIRGRLLFFCMHAVYLLLLFEGGYYSSKYGITKPICFTMLMQVIKLCNIFSMLSYYYFYIHFQLTKSQECRDCKVFATDTILATLMTCARSKYSWDIVVYREGDYLFFDKRDTSQFGEYDYKCFVYSC